MTYLVGDKQYSNKIDAINEANKTLADIEWHFYSQFDTIDWTIEPEPSLEELYKNRAIQLRNKYKYLVLFFSGGSDSVNMLETFLANNIKVDEVIATYPKKGLINFTPNNTDTSAKNNISEFTYTTQPYLIELQTRLPDLKVTILDYFDNMLEYKSMDWLVESTDWIHPCQVAKFKINNHLDDELNKGSVGFVYGIDKPRLFKWNKTNTYYNVIPDFIINGAIKPTDHANAFVELFYITPDMPELLVKAAHVVLNTLPVNTKLNDVMNLEAKDKPDEYYTMIQHEIIPYIYPTIKKLDFQTGKGNSRFMVESDDWFYELHKDSPLYNMVMTDYDNFIRSVNEKYFEWYNDKPVGLKPFYKLYKLR